MNVTQLVQYQPSPVSQSAHNRSTLNGYRIGTKTLCQYQRISVSAPQRFKRSSAKDVNTFNGGKDLCRQYQHFEGILVLKCYAEDAVKLSLVLFSPISQISTYSKLLVFPSVVICLCSSQQDPTSRSIVLSCFQVIACPRSLLPSTLACLTLSLTSLPMHSPSPA